MAVRAIPRPRLFRRLDRAGKRPITWVWGPPGAGKTTLIASYLGLRPFRRLWYQVDAGDGDIATFFYHLGRAAPRRRRPLPPLTPEYRSHISVFARRYFRELYERLAPPFVFVLDNYQEAPADALLHDVLRDAVEELPEGGRIIVASRTDPPGTMARLRVHQAVDVIDWPELRLTVAEAAGLPRTLLGRQLPAATVRRLYDQADGWFAGLVLLLRQDASEPPAPSRPLPRSQVLFDYFAGEIFRGSDQRTRLVLLETSFVPSVTAEMAEALTGRPDAVDVVAELHRKSHFTNKRPGAKGAYEYHPLFREFLLAEAHRTFAAGRVAEIRHRAAGLLEAAGDVDAAAEMLLGQRDWDGLAGLICRHAPAMLAQGRVETVERWLAHEPAAVFASTPWLFCWRGMCRLGRRHDECASDCEQALAGFRRQRDTDGMFLAWSLIVLNHVMAGWLSSLDDLIARLDELVKESPSRASEDVEARVAAAMLLAIAYRQPSHPDGARWAARALELTRGHPDLALRAFAATSWFIYHWERGEAYKASVVVDEMRTIARRRDIPSVIALHAAVPVVWHELLWALPSYRQTVAEMRALARATGLRHVLSTTMACWGAFAALSDGDQDAADTWIRDMGDEVGDCGPTYQVAYLGLRVLDGLARGDVEAASAAEREMARRGYTSGMPYEEGVVRITAAHVCHERGMHDQARAHVQRSLVVAAAIGSPYLEWMARLAEAHLLLERGREGEGLEALRLAMEVGRAGGYVNSPVWRPGMMARLCARALEARIEPDYARDLVKRRRLVCEPPPVTVESWPWPVKVFTLGRFSVLSDDRPLRFVGKVQRKPLALLKAVIALGNPGVREERLADLLWPEAEGDAARRALTSAVFRLRRLLGHDAALLRGDGQISLNPGYCWTDLWAVERLLDRTEAAAAADRGGTSASAVRWMGQAAALYQGPVFGGIDDPAGSSVRADRLRRRILRQLLALARHREAATDWQGAADLFDTALRVDPCAEEACRGLMAAHYTLGRPADSRAVYHLCREALEQQHGLTPSPATEAVLREVSATPSEVGLGGWSRRAAPVSRGLR